LRYRDWSWEGESSVNFQIQKNLTAFVSDPLGSAFIQKKQAGINIVVNPVPLPAAVLFLDAGIVGLIGFSRRTA